MYFINLYFFSPTGRKFLLKTGCLWMLIAGMHLPVLAARPKIATQTGQHAYQIQLVQEWLYNYCETQSNTEIEITALKLTTLIDRFRRRKAGYQSEEQWLENIFYQVHKKFLKHYEEFSNVSDLFEGGNYNCVSGTALYALICELLYIPYAIRETKYHVYLLALVDGKKVLIESTDPVHGFVSQPSTIQNLIETFHNEGGAGNMRSWPVNSTVDWIQLTGLQYFNIAVQFYNKKNLQDALAYLNKAMQYYKSSRIILFKEHILQLTASYPKPQEPHKL